MTKSRKIRNFRLRVSQLLHRPVQQLDRKARLAAYQLRLWWFVISKMSRDRMLQVAGALSFQTLLSLIPMTLLFFLLVNAIVPDEQLRQRVRSFIFQQFSLEDARYVPLDDDAPYQSDDRQLPPDEAANGTDEAAIGDHDGLSEAEAGALQEQQTVATWLSDRIDLLISRDSDETRAPLTIFSVFFLLFGGLGIFTIVEWAFNAVWEVPRGRSFLSRLYGLAASLMLLTLLLGLAMWGVLQVSVLAQQSPFALLWQTLARLVPLLTSWIVFFALYKLVPNAYVQTRAALIAAIVSGTVWEFGAKLGFELYVQNSTGITRLYGNLALIPVFMFWVWISWLILMFGAELSYVIQHMKTLTREQLEGRTRRFLQADFAALALALVITRRFDDEQSPPTADELAWLLNVPEGDARSVLEMMHRANLVRCAERDEDANEGYVPARPPQKVTVAEVMHAGRQLQYVNGAAVETGPLLIAVEQYVQQFMSAAHQSFEATTLETLADELADQVRRTTAGDRGRETQ